MAKADEPDIEQPSEKTPLLQDKGKALVSGGAGAVVQVGGRLGAQYEDMHGTWDQMFLKHKNQAFGEDLELAVRAAFFVLVAAAPFLAPKELCPVCHYAVSTGFYTATSCIYMIFVLYKTTGDTINFAYSAFMGTVIAVINMWLMLGFMPGGYSPAHPEYFYGGSIWGAAFIFGMLYLNFEMCTRVFALATFVFYFMIFQNHTITNTGFDNNFEISIDNAATSELLCATSGILIGVLASCLPYPLMATWKAEETTEKLCKQLVWTWLDFAEFYTSAEHDPYQLNLLNRELAVLKSETGVLSGYVGAAWYECLGGGKTQKKRRMMMRLDAYLTGAFDRLATILQATQAEDYSQFHDDLMSEMKGDIMHLIDQTGTLLGECIDAIHAAGFSSESAMEANKLSDQMEEDMGKFTVKWIAALKKANKYQITDETSTENVVGANLCTWLVNTRKFADDLQEKNDYQLPTDAASWKDGAGAMGVFAPTVLGDKEHIGWVFRFWVAIMAAFWTGHFGVGGNMILPHNASLSSTICVMLSKARGSALTANLKRLQGVILGNVIGQLFYALLAWCVWWGYLAVGTTLFVWTSISLYLYYHSEGYSTVGILLCVFGASSLLQGCSDEVFNPTGAYYGIVNVTAGLIILVIVDTLFSPGRSSDAALDAYFSAWEPLQKQTKDLFDPELTDLPARSGKVRGLINAAVGCGQEAGQEPRYWRNDWQDAQFTRAVECLRVFRFCTANVEAASSSPKPDGDGRVKEESFLKAIRLDSFKPVLDLLEKQMEDVKQKVKKLLQNELPGKHAFEKDDLTLGGDAEAKRVMAGFMEEVNKIIDGLPSAEKTLEDDPVADMCVLVTSLQTLFSEIEAVKQSLVA